MWEDQILQMDVMMRYLTEMRSTAARRVRRLAPARVPDAPARPVRRDLVVNLADAQRNLLFHLYQEANLPARPPPPPRRAALPKKKVLALTQADQKLAMECAICHDTHVKVECATVECKHTFGRTCLSAWVTTCSARDKPVTCPTCRAVTREITEYRPRKVASKAAPPPPPPVPVVIEIEE
jgi:hypothetical protein